MQVKFQLTNPVKGNWKWLRGINFQKILFLFQEVLHILAIQVQIQNQNISKLLGFSLIQTYTATNQNSFKFNFQFLLHKYWCLICNGINSETFVDEKVVNRMFSFKKLSINKYTRYICNAYWLDNNNPKGQRKQNNGEV